LHREAAKINLATARARLDGDLIDNQIKAAQLRKMTDVGPPMPSIDGMSGSLTSGSSNLLPPPVELQSNRVTRADPGSSFKEAGSVSDVSFARTAGGGLAVIPSQDFQDRAGDMFAPSLMWGLRNSLLPLFQKGGIHPPPDPRLFPLPRGMRWKWSNLHQEFRPVRMR